MDMRNRIKKIESWGLSGNSVDIKWVFGWRWLGIREQPRL